VHSAVGLSTGVPPHQTRTLGRDTHSHNSGLLHGGHGDAVRAHDDEPRTVRPRDEVARHLSQLRAHRLRPPNSVETAVRASDGRRPVARPWRPRLGLAAAVRGVTPLKLVSCGSKRARPAPGLPTPPSHAQATASPQGGEATPTTLPREHTGRSTQPRAFRPTVPPRCTAGSTARAPTYGTTVSPAWRVKTQSRMKSALLARARVAAR